MKCFVWNEKLENAVKGSSCFSYIELHAAHKYVGKNAGFLVLNMEVYIFTTRFLMDNYGTDGNISFTEVFFRP
jgi:hypothetical protein